MLEKEETFFATPAASSHHIIRFITRKVRVVRSSQLQSSILLLENVRVNCTIHFDFEPVKLKHVDVFSKK